MMVGKLRIFQTSRTTAQKARHTYGGMPHPGTRDHHEEHVSRNPPVYFFKNHTINFRLTEGRHKRKSSTEGEEGDPL